MEEEIKMLFQLAYLSVATANQRLNGGDFLSVAVPLMDELRKQNNNETFLRKAARIMVEEFNNLLNPKLPAHELENMIETIYNPGPMTRALAKQIADEFVKTHSK